MAFALTEARRAQALDYLGANFLTSDRDPRTYGNSTPFVLTDALLLLEGNMRSIDTQAKLDKILALLDEIEASRAFINQARKLLIVSKVEGAATINHRMMNALWEQDYILVKDMANKLGSPVLYHPWKDSGTGYGTKVVGGNC